MIFETKKESLSTEKKVQVIISLLKYLKFVNLATLVLKRIGGLEDNRI